MSFFPEIFCIDGDKGRLFLCIIKELRYSLVLDNSVRAKFTDRNNLTIVPFSYDLN